MRIQGKFMTLATTLSMVAVFTPTTALAQSYAVPGAQVVELTGDDFDRAGHQLASGDVNGDGEQDLLVGSPVGDGLVRVYFGPLDPGMSPYDHQAADAVFEGASGSEFGWALTTADVNGDGVDDVVTTAPSERANGKNGVLYVFEGPINPTTYGTSDASIAIEAPASSSSYFGQSITSGDFNGDGQVDVAVGDYDDHSTAYVMFSFSSGRYQLGGADTGWTEFLGDARLGCALSAGDFNGDGLDELAIAAPGEPGLSLADWAGVTFLVYGRTEFKPSYDLNQLSDMALKMYDIAAFFGEAEGENVGHALAFGDLNHDGLDELIVGAPYKRCTTCNASFRKTGSVYVVDGRADIASGRALLGHQPFRTLTDVQQHMGEADGDLFGFSVAYVGATQSAPITPQFGVGAPGAAKAYLMAGDGFEACAYTWDADTMRFERKCLKLSNSSTTTYVHDNPRSYFGYSVLGNSQLIDHGFYQFTNFAVGATYQLDFSSENFGPGHTYVFTP